MSGGDPDNPRALRQSDEMITGAARSKVKRQPTRALGDGMTEARGAVLLRQYDDLRRRIEAADVSARSVCFNYISSTFGSISDAYEMASSADRERMLKAVLDVSRKLWDGGNRPQALALGVIMLNVESRFVAGEDAAFVKAETDALIKGASS